MLRKIVKPIFVTISNKKFNNRNSEIFKINSEKISVGILFKYFTKLLNFSTISPGL